MLNRKKKISFFILILIPGISSRAITTTKPLQKHVVNQKKFQEIIIDKPETNCSLIFTFIFNNFLSLNGTPNGAMIKFSCLISGCSNKSYTESLYEGGFYLLPGTDKANPCTALTLYESTMTAAGTPLIISDRKSVV